MANRMQVRGSRQMEQRLEAMPKAIRKVFEEELAAAGEEITSMQRRMAPVDSGDLRDSIRWERGRVVHGKKGLIKPRKVRVGFQDNNLSVTIFTDDMKARWIEFGTSQNPHPRPFFYPAVRALRRKIINRIRRKMNRAIKQEAAKRGRS